MNNMVMTGGDAFDSVDSFVAACSDAAGQTWGDHASEMISWWTSEQSGQVRSTADCVMFDRVGENRTDLALLTLAAAGNAWGQQLSYSAGEVCAEQAAAAKQATVQAAQAADQRLNITVGLLRAS